MRDAPTLNLPPDGWSDRLDPRRNNFDVLRFLLASLVVLSHSYSIVLPKALWDREPLMALTGRQLSLGSMAVYGFFAISGFLIATSWSRSKSFGDFFRKRAWRLYPGFAVMTLACAFLVVPLAVGSGPHVEARTLGKVLYRTVVFDAWEDPAAFAGHENAAINASAWTIPYEFWCYLILAGLAAVGVLRRRAWVVGLAAAAYVAQMAFATWNCGPVWTDWLPATASYHVGRVVGVPANWPAFLTYFLAGASFFAWRDKIPHSPRLAAACAVALVVAARVHPLLQFVLPACGVYLLFWASLHPKLRFETFGRRGDFSYGIYLYSFPIQQLLIAWVGPTRVQPLQLFAMSMPLSLAAGVLSWHGVEKWFVARRKPAVARPSAPTGRPIRQPIWTRYVLPIRLALAGRFGAAS